MDQRYTGGDPQPWQPRTPSPFVTHQDMAPVHTKIGELARGQDAIVSSYNHLRGDMLQHFDRLEALLRQQRAPASDSLQLNVRSVALLIGAGALLGALAGRPVLTALGLS